MLLNSTADKIQFLKTELQLPSTMNLHENLDQNDLDGSKLKLTARCDLDRQLI